MTTILEPKELKGLSFIRDKVIYHGKTPSLRTISVHMGFKSPRSASLLIGRLIKKGYLERTTKGNLRLLKEIDGGIQSEQVIDLPLVGYAPCGLPLLAEENTEAWIPVSKRIAKPGARYFLLRAVGDSMNQRNINDGDLMIVRQQPVAENGDRVIALINDSATVKEFQRKGDKVILMPRSSNPIHKPIILYSDFMIQGLVVDTLPNPLE
jgi:repressor LexA